MSIQNKISKCLLLMFLLICVTVQYYGSNKCHQLKSTSNPDNQNNSIPNNQKNFLKQTLLTKIPFKKPPQNPLKFADFQSGSYTLQKSNYTPTNSLYQKNSRYFCFNLTFSYTPPQNGYEIAICNSFLIEAFKKIEQLEQQKGLDFAIRFKKQQTYVNGLFIIESQSKWTIVNIWYVITSRYDLRAGNFAADTSNFLNCHSYQQNTTVQHTLQTPWRGTKDRNHVVVVAFLSGFKTFDNLLRLSLENERIDMINNKILIDIIIQQADAPIQQLFISYFIFELGFSYQLQNLIDIQVLPDKQDDVFIGIRGIQPKVQSSNTNSGFLRSQLNQSANKFGFGLNQLWNVQQNKNFLRSTSNGRIDFPYIYNEQITLDNLGKILMKNHFHEYFNVKGIVIKHQFLLPLSKISNQVFALNEQNSTVQCLTLQQCKESGNFIKSYLDERGIFMDQCIECGSYASYNEQIGYCVCSNGTKQIIPGVCIKIENWCKDGSKIINSLSNTQICTKVDLVSKDSNQQIQNNEISIKQDNTKNSISQQIQKKAQQKVIQTKSQVKLTSDCPQGMIMNYIKNICQCPGQRSYYNANKKICQSCPQFSQWSSQKLVCLCEKGAYKIYGTQKCIKCDKNAYFTGRTCVCFPNFDGNGVTCTQKEKSGEYHFLGSGFIIN